MQRTQPGGADAHGGPSGLGRLARVNPTTAFLVALGVVLAGLLLPGIVGGLFLIALAVGLGALTRLTWRVQAPQTKVVRLLMLTLLVGGALYKIM